MSERMPGLAVCISGPSGVGKGTVIQELRKIYPQLWLSISATSRPARGFEKDGEDYFFVDSAHFEALIQQGEILEYDRFCGNYYGTPRQAIQKRLDAGQDVVLDITVKGSLAVKEKFPRAVTIFLLPPSLAELAKRLSHRNTDSPESQVKRLAQAKQEIMMAEQFDFVVTNNDLSQCLRDVTAIMQAEKLRPQRREAVLHALLEESLPHIKGGKSIC